MMKALTSVGVGVSVCAGQVAHIYHRHPETANLQVSVCAGQAAHIYHRRKNTCAYLPPYVRIFTTVRAHIYHRTRSYKQGLTCTYLWSYPAAITVSPRTICSRLKLISYRSLQRYARWHRGLPRRRCATPCLHEIVVTLIRQRCTGIAPRQVSWSPAAQLDAPADERMRQWSG